MQRKKLPQNFLRIEKTNTFPRVKAQELNCIFGGILKVFLWNPWY